MKTDYWLDQIPLWGVFLLMVAAVMLAIRAGTFLGMRRRRKPEHETEASLGTTIGAILGLLAFMLAFTFGMTAERFQARKELLLDEVKAIETAYLRAQLLRPPHQSEVRALLRQYVDLRVDLFKQDSSLSPQEARRFLARSEALQQQMWSHAIALSEADRSSEIDALFISALSDMIEMQTGRVTVFMYRIPPTIWDLLFFITVLVMLTTGYQAGLSGKGSLKMGLVLALTFASVILLITDLDRASEGRLRVSQQPMLNLQARLHAPPS